MTGFIAPMLAQRFTTWDRLPKGAVFSQPKFNGVRCIATRAGLFSRTGHPYTACDHVRDGLARVFSAAPGLALDGELYSHGMDLNEILSLVQQQRDWDGRCSDLIRFHAYDVPSVEGAFSDRFTALDAVRGTPAVEVAPTAPIADFGALNSAYASYLADGYEGQIVRIDGGYQPGKRSSLLLKRKAFQDAEFPLVGVHEATGEWAGHAKSATFRLPDGRTFGASVAGPRSFVSDLLGTWRRYGSATVRFLGLNADGIPVPAVAVAFHLGNARRL